jgi:hypothetical protein
MLIAHLVEGWRVYSKRPSVGWGDRVIGCSRRCFFFKLTRRREHSPDIFSTCMIRSYDPEYTPSRPIWEVKQDSARPVLRTEMTREALVTNLLPPFYAIRMYGRECARNRPEKRANGAVSALRVGRGGRPRRPAGAAGSNRELEQSHCHVAELFFSSHFPPFFTSIHGDQYVASIWHRDDHREVLITRPPHFRETWSTRVHTQQTLEQRSNRRVNVGAHNVDRQRK